MGCGLGLNYFEPQLIIQEYVGCRDPFRQWQLCFDFMTPCSNMEKINIKQQQMETHHIDPNRASKLCVQIRVENHRLTTLAYGMEDLGGFKVSRVPSWFQFSKFDISTPKDALQETHLPWPSASAFCTHSWCGPMMRGRKQLPATLSSPGMHGSSSPHWDI